MECRQSAIKASRYAFKSTCLQQILWGYTLRFVHLDKIIYCQFLFDFLNGCYQRGRSFSCSQVSLGFNPEYNFYIISMFFKFWIHLPQIVYMRICDIFKSYVLPSSSFENRKRSSKYNS